VTSSLLAQSRGPEKGRRRLSEEMESIIDTALRDTYRKRERPSVRALHDRVCALCHAKGLAAPPWNAVRARIDLIDRKDLVRDPECHAAVNRETVIGHDFNGLRLHITFGCAVYRETGNGFMQFI